MASEAPYPQGWIQTRFGRFDPDHPVFDVRDIAHALGMIVRYNGHVKRFYSVAEHSVLVCALMREVTGGDPYEGLLHDATEAYLSDVPKPFKKLLPELGAWDERMESDLRRQFGLPHPSTPECKRADGLALRIESHFLMPDGGKGYYYPPGIQEQGDDLIEKGWRVTGLEPVSATNFWHHVFSHYTLKRHAATKKG